MDIDADIERWLGERERVAVATVIEVHGSTPRAAGARLAVTAGGRMTGSVSGGCVENDVCRRARAVLESGRPVIASFAIGESAETGVGLSCGGGIDVLIEPLANDAVWRASRAAASRGEGAVRATAVAPSKLLGRRMLVLADEALGSIDAGLDAPIVDRARALLREGGEAGVRTVVVGASSASVFMEPVLAPARLFLVGATDTAAALTTVAKLLGFRVVVIDAREAYLSRERFPAADELVCAWPEEALTAAGLDRRSYVVTLAHDSKLDVPALATALRSAACYVGALGSRRTHERRRQTLREKGFGEAELARIHAPVGLDLGGRMPAEIAVSIASEIVAVANGKDRSGPIVREDTANGAA